MAKRISEEDVRRNPAKTRTIISNRREYFEDTTLSDVLVEGKHFSYQLEDAVRAIGVKVARKTAIPEGWYRVIVSRSTRFKRDMILLYNEETSDGRYICTDGIIEFSGIRNHGGNTHLDTEGCLVTAYRRVSPKVIQNRSDKDLLKIVEGWIAEGHEVYWGIFNNPQFQ